MNKFLKVGLLVAVASVMCALPAFAVEYEATLLDGTIMFDGPEGDFLAYPTSASCTGDATYKDLRNNLSEFVGRNGRVELQTHPCRGKIISVCIGYDSYFEDGVCATVRMENNTGD